MTSIDTSALPDKAAFAAANNWEYGATAPAPQVDVPLFSRLQNATVTDRFSDSTFEAGTVTGSIKGGGEKKFSVGYLAVRLTQPIAQFELESTRNNATKGTTVPLSMPDGNRIPLFGALANSFVLYGPDGHEGDALNTFTPDLMALLADPTGDFDVEVVNDVFLVSATKPFDLADPALWERLTKIRTLVAEKDLTLTRPAPYAGDRVLGGVGPGGVVPSGVVPAEVAMVASVGATAIGTIVGIIGAIVGGVAAIIGVVIAIVAALVVH